MKAAERHFLEWGSERIEDIGFVRCPACDASYPASILRKHPRSERNRAWGIAHTHCPDCEHEGLMHDRVTWREFCERRAPSRRAAVLMFWKLAEQHHPAAVLPAGSPRKGQQPKTARFKRRGGHPGTVQKRIDRTRRWASPDTVEVTVQQWERRLREILSENSDDGAGTALLTLVADWYGPQLQADHGLLGETERVMLHAYIVGVLGELIVHRFDPHAERPYAEVPGFLAWARECHQAIGAP